MGNLDIDTQVFEDWGRLQLVIDGEDYTFYRGVPTIINSWSFAEPFSDRDCVITFPGITSYENLDDMPFEIFDDVEIAHINPDNEYVRNVFEGMVVSIDDDLSETENALTIQCIGAMYQADFFIKPTIFNDYTFDLATAIKETFDERIDNYGLRLKKMQAYVYCNIASRNRGSFNPLLTGWIQEMLSTAHTQAFLYGAPQGQTDAEKAVALSYGIDPDTSDPEGYMITGNHGTYLSFGEDFPNWGSWSALIRFLIANGDPRVELTDSAMRRDFNGIWSVNKKGQVGLHSDTTWGNPTLNYDDLLPYGDIDGHDYDVVAIDVAPGNGYWLLDETGEVFNFGPAATDYGSHVQGQTAIDLAAKRDGTGYWILFTNGRIQGKGSCDTYIATGDDPVAIAATGDDGVWVVYEDGNVDTFGDAVDYGSAESNSGPPVVDIDSNFEGTGYALLREDGFIHVYGGYPTGLGHGRYAAVPTAGGNVYQWTLNKIADRQPQLRIKDMWNNHWSVTVGTPGVTHSLTRDNTQYPNVFYGEGINEQGCRWRNSKYPNFRPDETPVWPGYSITTSINSTAPGVIVWEREMASRGWDVTVDGIYSAADARVCQIFQSSAGIQVDGVIGAQTWAATFEVGSNAGDASGAYYAPIVNDRRVEPFLYDATGAKTGDNPNFDRTRVRIEGYDNYGEKISKEEAKISAFGRQKFYNNPGYSGTITLKSDPEEGHRLDIKAGENIVYKSYRGEDMRFHISEVSVDAQSLTVTLTVDTLGRDAMTLASMLNRDREATTPARVQTRLDSQATAVEDRFVVFDCESGAGRIPYHGVAAGLWNILRIPVGEFGEIVQTDLRSSVVTYFAAAIFDRPITANELAILGDPDDEDFWKDFPEEKGLIIAWGGDGQMAGYYPGLESDEDVATGIMIDRSSWTYWTTVRPWIWVALWSPVTTYMEGRLYPGSESVGLVPDVTAIA